MALQNVNISLTFIMLMMVQAEFEFEAENYSGIIYDALLPEIKEDYQRTRTTLKLKAGLLILNVEANDIVSMRAALNGWLRLIKITYEMCTIANATLFMRDGKSPHRSPLGAAERRTPTY